LIGALGLLAALTADVAAPTVGLASMMRAAAIVGAVIHLALGALLMGDTEWPRTAAIVWCIIGLVAVVALPALAACNTERAALVVLMKLFFFVGMLVLLPGSAEKGRRWAGCLIALVPYFLLKLLGGLQFAARTGFFEAGEFLRGFFGMG
jgi:hypothetical protein